jgi:transcriptional regulator with XRE-family HTH domain
MDLYDYFYKCKKECGLEMQDFAKDIGVSASFLSLLINGRTPPSFTLALKIQDITKGKVTLLELMDYAQKNMKKKNKSILPTS